VRVRLGKLPTVTAVGRLSSRGAAGFESQCVAVYIAPFWITHKNHSAENRRSIKRHLLRHHTAQGKSKDITDLKTKAIEECRRVSRHSADRLRHHAGGSAKPGAFHGRAPLPK